MMPQKRCPECNTDAPVSAAFCNWCGHKYRTQFEQPIDPFYRPSPFYQPPIYANRLSSNLPRPSFVSQHPFISVVVVSAILLLMIGTIVFISKTGSHDEHDINIQQGASVTDYVTQLNQNINRLQVDLDGARGAIANLQMDDSSRQGLIFGYCAAMQQDIQAGRQIAVPPAYRGSAEKYNEGLDELWVVSIKIPSDVQRDDEDDLARCRNYIDAATDSFSQSEDLLKHEHGDYR